MFVTNRQMRRHPEMFGITLYAPDGGGGADGGAGAGAGADGGDGGAGGGENNGAQLPADVAEYNALPEETRALIDRYRNLGAEEKANAIIAERESAAEAERRSREDNAEGESFEEALKAAREKLAAKKFATKQLKAGADPDSPEYVDAEVGLSDADLDEAMQSILGHKGTLGQREQVRVLSDMADALINQLPEDLRDPFVASVSADDPSKALALPQWLGRWTVNALAAALPDTKAEGAEKSIRAEFIENAGELTDMGKVREAWAKQLEKHDLTVFTRGWSEGNKSPDGTPTLQSSGAKPGFSAEGKTAREVADALKSGDLNFEQALKDAQKAG